MQLFISVLVYTATTASPTQTQAKPISTFLPASSDGLSIKKMSLADALRAKGVLTQAKEQARIGNTCGDMGCG